MRRVSVRWTTRDVQEWSAVFDVPDDVPDEDIYDYFSDGNNEHLVDWDGDTHINDGVMIEFIRETQEIRRLP